MSDNQRAVNPQTGETVEYNGEAWVPVNDRSVGQQLMHQLGLTARYGLEGASQIPTMVGDVLNSTANLGIMGVNKVAGTDIPYLGLMRDFREKALQDLPKPEGAGERVVGEATKMLATVPGFAGVAKAGELAGTEALAPMGEKLLQQSGAAIGAGLGYGGAKEVTENPWLQLAASGVGALGGGGLATLAENAATAGPRAAAPTTETIKGMSQSAYRDAEEAGAIIKPNTIQRLNAEFQGYLAKKAYEPALQSKIPVLLDRLQKASGENITAEGVDVLRQIAGDIVKDGNSKERMLAGQLISQIDDMMENLRPEDVVMGDAAGAAGALAKGRDLWKTYRKSEMVDDLLKNAKIDAATVNSGGNLQNKIAQAFKPILKDPKIRRLFTKEELDAVANIANGTWTRNTLRIIGRLAPSSNSWLGPLMTSIGSAGTGAAFGGPPGIAAGLAVPAIGSAAKYLATRGTENAVGKLSDVVRSNAGPKLPPFNGGGITAQDIARVLMSSGPNARMTPRIMQMIEALAPSAAPASQPNNTSPRRQP